jgi:NTP pyrophosphatase (non-canonical NTP hydrolase)
MSTRCSFFYNHDLNSQIHVFEDMAEGHDDIFIEKTQTIDTTIKLSVEEVLCIAQSFDINELKRQADLDDESLHKAASESVQKNSTGSSFFKGLFYADMPKGENTPIEEQVEFEFEKFKNTRKKLRDLLDKVESKSRTSHKFYFGLEHVK